MNSSSNPDMKHVFEHLASIKTTEPNANLYVKTISKLQSRNVVPMFWVRVAACLFVAFITTEFYFSVSKVNSTQKDNSIIICKTNNILYNE